MLDSSLNASLLLRNFEYLHSRNENQCTDSSRAGIRAEGSAPKVGLLNSTPHCVFVNSINVGIVGEETHTVRL